MPLKFDDNHDEPFLCVCFTSQDTFIIKRIMSGVRAGFPETASEREGEKDGEMKEEKCNKEKKKGFKNKIDHQVQI